MSFGENGFVKAKFPHRTVETEIPNLSIREGTATAVCKRESSASVCTRKARCGQPRPGLPKRGLSVKAKLPIPRQMSHTHTGPCV